MSMLPSSAQIMAGAIRNGSADSENFSNFFESWLTEQNNYLEELARVSNDIRETTIPGEVEEGHRQGVLVSLIDRVTRHYEHYYRTKSRWVKHDALAMLTPPWRSTLEDAFLWIGGWRPSMAFHLLYSKSGLQLEAALAELIQGIHVGNLADLSPDQINQVNTLQTRTIREERDITENLAKHQETVADTSMVELSHIVTQLIRGNEDVGAAAGTTANGINTERVQSTLASKEEGLVEILKKADDLRLNTLKEILGILTPPQAVHFLIAAAELHLRLHDWGKRRDAMHHAGHRRPGENQS